MIKVLWGSDWDALFARDTHHALLRQFAATVDGQYQTLGANDGDYNRDHFFNLDPELQALVAHMTPAEIDGLTRGGHDFRKLYAAFRAAREHKGQPTVILAKTKKGYGMGAAGESRMTAHQQKKLDVDALRAFRDRFALPLSDDDLASLRFYKPPEDSREMAYLRERRAALGGALPRRRREAPTVPIPPLESYATFAVAADGKEMSTTMAAVRLLGNLLKDKTLGPAIVPIVADEARTFGMASLFRQVGIYSPQGQLYEPEDAHSMLAYREARDGQLLEEGITEAGALCSWIAAATSYSVHGARDAAVLHLLLDVRLPARRRPDLGRGRPARPRLPARRDRRPHDARRRGPAAPGRQQPRGRGHRSQLPRVRPGVRGRARRDPRPRHAADDGAAGGRVLLRHRDERELRAPVAARGRCAADPARHVSLRRARGAMRGACACWAPARSCARSSRRRRCWRANGTSAATSSASRASASWRARPARWSAGTASIRRPRRARVTSRDLLAGDAPIVAAIDYVRAYPELIAPHVRAPFTALGTDGFGRSDTRRALRRFFEVDRQHVVVAALAALEGPAPGKAARLADALQRYGIETEAAPPWTR